MHMPVQTRFITRLRRISVGVVITRVYPNSGKPAQKAATRSIGHPAAVVGDATTASTFSPITIRP